jgi:hypothetical protein
MFLYRYTVPKQQGAVMKAVHLIIATTLLMAAATYAADYKVDGNFSKGVFIQLAVDSNDALYALDSAGKITCFKSDGTVESSISTKVANAGAFAITPDGTFLVFSDITEMKKVKSGARMVKVNIPVGVECTVFNASGQQQTTSKIDCLKSVKTARFTGGKLVVADLSARALVLIDPETLKETGRIKDGLRLCCGIFDFCEAPDNTIAISNLGAFKVQQYSLDGKLIMEFGKRGRKLDDFQGCCNPVSAAYLPNGEILTVEKDPTRIKIYDSKGKNAHQIEGVDELVKGCSFIPSALDSKGTIYLASATKKCIVKCVEK